MEDMDNNVLEVGKTIKIYFDKVADAALQKPLGERTLGDIYALGFSKRPSR